MWSTSIGNPVTVIELSSTVAEVRDGLSDCITEVVGPVPFTCIERIPGSIVVISRSTHVMLFSRVISRNQPSSSASAHRR